MAYFNDLDQLISSQGTILSSNPSPAEVLAEKGCPSTSIAVLNHGNIASHCISTLGDNDQTLFQACSISKPIAGMATMKLVQQGKLRISDKIIEILPKSASKLLETPQTKHLLPQITVKHLMSHTSGLSVGGFAGYSGDLPSHEAILSGNAPSNTLQVRLYGLPGYDFTYSGGGMMVLQIILETVTGKDFPTLMQELIFEPLGMSRSFYKLAETETNIARSHYTGYTPSEDKWRVNPEQAAAGLWTTPTDLLKAIRAVQQSLRNTTNSEETILVKEIVQQMLTEVQGGMALTWVAPRDPGLVFGHGGSNFPGWRCFVVGFGETPSRSDPNAKLPGSSNGKDGLDLENSGICVMTNSMCGDRIVWKVIHAISSFMKWPRIPSVGFWYIGTIPFTAHPSTLDPEWEDWSGTWIDEENKDKIMTFEADSDGSPILRYGKDLSAKLVPAAIPGLELVGKKSINLNIEGLEMMLRLAWKEDSRVMELWQGGNGSASVSDFKSKED